MKVIPDNIITSVTASHEESGYPDENLLDGYPGFLWKGTATTETLTFDLTSGADGIAIFNTNAVEYEITAVDKDSAPVALSASITAEYLDGDYGYIFYEFQGVEPSTSPWTFTIELTANSEVFCGALIGGLIRTFGNPTYSVSDEVKDLSVISEYNAGGIHIKDRDILRVFDVVQVVERDTDFHDFIFSVKKEIKSNPAAWLIIDNLDTTAQQNSRWAIYARFTKEPTGEHLYPDYTVLKWQLTEIK